MLHENYHQLNTMIKTTKAIQIKKKIIELRNFIENQSNLNLSTF